MAKYDGLVLVAGSSGGVGKRVLKTLRNEGIKARALVRDPAKAEILEKAGFEAVLVDITDEKTAPEKLKEAMKGVTAVISALGTNNPFSKTNGITQVDYNGNRRLVDAAREAGVERYILNSSMGLAEKPNLLKPFSIPFYPKWKADAYLAKSGLTYTIIRPGGLVDSDKELKGPPGWVRTPVLAEADLSGEGGFGSLMGRVHRDDVAETMVKSLWSPATHNKVFDLLDRASIKSKYKSRIAANVF